MASTTADLLRRVRINIRDLIFKYRDDEIIDAGLSPTLRELEHKTFTKKRLGTITGDGATFQFAPPATLGVVHWVESVRRQPGNAELNFVASRELKFESVATPDKWSWNGSQFEFDPIPESGIVLEVRAFCSPNTPTAGNNIGTDELGLALDIEDALVLGASWRMSEVDSEPDRANRFFAQFQARMDEIRSKADPDRGTPRTLPDLSGVEDRYFVNF